MPGDRFRVVSTGPRRTGQRTLDLLAEAIADLSREDRAILEPMQYRLGKSLVNRVVRGGYTITRQVSDG